MHSLIVFLQSVRLIGGGGRGICQPFRPAIIKWNLCEEEIGVGFLVFTS